MAAVLIALAAAGFYLYREVQSYAATATVQMATPAAGQTGGSATGPNLQLITGTDVTALAASTLQVTPSPALASNVEATYDADTSVVSVKATESTAVQAKQVANAFADGYVTQLKAQANASTAALQGQLNKLTDQIAALNKKIAVSPNDQLLKTQYQSASSTYTTIYNEFTTASIAPPPASLLKEAIDGTSTSQPKTEVLGLAFLVGLLAGVGFVLLRAPFDTRLRSVEEVELYGQSPVLAQLPLTKGLRRGSTTLSVVEAARTPFSESIRELRTSAQVLLGGSGSAALVVTSPAPYDGKTLITANLAASFALSGKRTILVSADLRRPRIHDFYGIAEPEKGLSELLALERPTSEEVVDLLRTTQVDGLMFLAAGTPAGDPADILATRRMSHVVEHLRSHADVVVIDAPPVLAVSDASIAASYADGAIVIVRANKSTQRALAETMKRLGSGHVNVLGVAFNRVKSITGSAYRGYYQAGEQDRTHEQELDIFVDQEPSGPANTQHTTAVATRASTTRRTLRSMGRPGRLRPTRQEDESSDARPRSTPEVAAEAASTEVLATPSDDVADRAPVESQISTSVEAPSAVETPAAVDGGVSPSAEPEPAVQDKLSVKPELAVQTEPAAEPETAVRDELSVATDELPTATSDERSTSTAPTRRRWRRRGGPAQAEQDRTKIDAPRPVASAEEDVSAAEDDTAVADDTAVSNQPEVLATSEPGVVPVSETSAAADVDPQPDDVAVRPSVTDAVEAGRVDGDAGWRPLGSPLAPRVTGRRRTAGRGPVR